MKLSSNLFQNNLVALLDNNLLPVADVDTLSRRLSTEFLTTNAVPTICFILHFQFSIFNSRNEQNSNIYSGNDDNPVQLCRKYRDRSPLVSVRRGNEGKRNYG